MSQFLARPESVDPERGRVLERHQEHWYAFHAGVPGALVHRDPDITWMSQPGVAWSNGGTGLRFRSETMDRRLDEILDHFSEVRRGAGFWVDRDATPASLEEHLRQRHFRCRKHFPGMWCDLRSLPTIPQPDGIQIEILASHDIYQDHPHPYFGRISTPIRRHELGRLAYMAAGSPRRVFDFVASRGSHPVGACTLFLSDAAAGFHDVGVLENERGRGIGSALMVFALQFARKAGYKEAVLLSSGMGYNVYRRAGFSEVCRIGYWYRAFR